MAKRVSKMIEEQVQFWALKNSGASLNAGHDKLPVITISREFGAKGAALAEMLGERLGFKVWDKELLDIISPIMWNEFGSNGWHPKAHVGLMVKYGKKLKKNNQSLPEYPLDITSALALSLTFRI